MNTWKKLLLLPVIFSLPALAQDTPQEEVLFSELVDCLISVSFNDIQNEVKQAEQSLALFNSVIQNMAYESGDITELDAEYAQLYPIAYKHCPGQINNVKRFGEQQS
jgi:hypothetical protein